jgi:bis(5'-nucleosyl)-tetraphosphatase (symmetrical)
MKMRSNTFIIGDVQGCYDQLVELVEKIDVIAPQAQLLFAGDLVNRGPKSLETLRFVKSLGARANTVLGNHDLHLLAVANDIRSAHRSDTLDDILQAPDREELLSWLRHRPMAMSLSNGKCLLVHAGLFPSWTSTKTISLAREIECLLQGENWLDLIRHMYGNTPNLWTDALTNQERYRCIINALTRIRFCDVDGAMDFDMKEGAAQAPAHLTPWFDFPERESQDCTVVFGHWSTLGLQIRENLISLDTGCVWGGKLTAVRLEDRLVVQVDSPQHLAPK